MEKPIVIILLLILAAWWIGWWMRKKLTKEEIDIKDRHIQSLKQDNEYLDKLTNTLFNEEDMYNSWIDGRYGRNNGESPADQFQEFIDRKYKPIEPVPEKLTI